VYILCALAATLEHRRWRCINDPSLFRCEARSTQGQKGDILTGPDLPVLGMQTARRSVALASGAGWHEAVGIRVRCHCHPVQVGRSAFAGYSFQSRVILLAVRWYLRFRAVVSGSRVGTPPPPRAHQRLGRQQPAVMGVVRERTGVAGSQRSSYRAWQGHHYPGDGW
jgi:hypothetical protein